MHPLDRNNSFDIIRLIAALAVVYTHALRLFAIGLDPVLMLFPSDDLSSFGVMSFFAISGYLVARSAARTQSTALYFKKRFLRIFPGLAACLAVTVLLVGPISTTLSLSDYFSEWATYRYLLNTFLFPLQTELPGVFLDNPRAGTVNGSLWTLSSEFVAYTLVAVVFVIRPMPVRATVVALGLIAVFLFGYHNYHILKGSFQLWYVLQEYGEDGEYFFWVYFNKVFAARLICLFFVGAMLNYAPKQLLDWRIAVLAIALIIASSNTVLYEPVLMLALPYAVISLGRLRPPVALQIGNADLSYGIYLYHAPLMQMTWTLTHSQLGLAGQLLVGVLVTVFAATMSWLLVERPALTLK